MSVLDNKIKTVTKHRTTDGREYSAYSNALEQQLYIEFRKFFKEEIKRRPGYWERINSDVDAAYDFIQRFLTWKEEITKDF